MPGNYESWVSWLDAYARGEDLPDTHLQPVGDSMGPHMQGRLVGRVSRAFEARTARWNQVLQRDLTAAGPRGRNALAAALVSGRSRLAPLIALTRSRLLPDDLRTAMAAALGSALQSVHDSLEDSARRGPEQEAMLGLIRDNNLLAALVPPSLPAVPARSARATGRRVIL